MLKKGFITVGIPVYNELQHIEEALKSVIDQSYKNYIVIISDNRSNDGTWEIIKNYEAKDVRIKAIQHDKNIGLFENWKYALEQCETEYFMWLGAHDFLGIDFMKNCLASFEKRNNIVLSFTNTHAVDSKSNILEKSDSNYVDFNDQLDMRNTNSFIEKWTFIMNKAHSCSAIQGIFKTEFIKKSVFKSLFSLDSLLLFDICRYGIIYIDQNHTDYYRRINYRPKNNQMKNKTQLYVNNGLVDPDVRNMYYQLGHEYFKSIVKSDATLSEKIKGFYLIYIKLLYKKKIWNPLSYIFYRKLIRRN